MKLDRQAFGTLVKQRRKELGWSQEALAAEVFCRSERKGDVSLVESGKANSTPETIRNFCTVLRIGATDLEGLAEILRFNTDYDHEVLESLRVRNGSLAAALENRERANRDQLIALSAQFGWKANSIPSESELRSFLDAKTLEYHSYRQLIESIDDRTLGLGNLKAAARDAAERFDFASVEEFLSRIDEVQTELAAEGKELRAANALLQGRVEDACRHFCSAAASFGGIDANEVIRRKIKYAKEVRDSRQDFVKVIRAIHILLSDVGPIEDHDPEFRVELLFLQAWVAQTKYDLFEEYEPSESAYHNLTKAIDLLKQIVSDEQLSISGVERCDALRRLGHLTCELSNFNTGSRVDQIREGLGYIDASIDEAIHAGSEQRRRSAVSIRARARFTLAMSGVPHNESLELLAAALTDSDAAKRPQNDYFSEPDYLESTLFHLRLLFTYGLVLALLSNDWSILARIPPETSGLIVETGGNRHRHINVELCRFRGIALCCLSMLSVSEQSVSDLKIGISDLEKCISPALAARDAAEQEFPIPPLNLNGEVRVAKAAYELLLGFQADERYETSTRADTLAEMCSLLEERKISEDSDFSILLPLFFKMLSDFGRLDSNFSGRPASWWIYAFNTAAG